MPHEAAAGRVVSRDGSMAQLHTGTVMRAMFAGSIALWSKAATIAKVRPRPRPGPDRPSSQLAPFLCSFRPADRVTLHVIAPRTGRRRRGYQGCVRCRGNGCRVYRLQDRCDPDHGAEVNPDHDGLKTPNSPLYTRLEPNDS